MAFDIGSALEGVGLSTSSLGIIPTVLIWVIAIVGLFILVGGGIAIFVWNRSYNQIIHLWATVNGQPQEIGLHRGKWRKVSDEGGTDRLLYVRWIKRWELPMYMTGKNHWHFHRRESDGEWINFKFQNIDELSRIMNIKFIDGDIRMQRVANEKILRNRLQKKTDWLAIAAQIGYVLFFIFIFIALIVLFSKLIDVSKSMEQASNSIASLASATRELINSTGVKVPINAPTQVGLQPV